jgi:hypothetical protein
VGEAEEQESDEFLESEVIDDTEIEVSDNK